MFQGNRTDSELDVIEHLLNWHFIKEQLENGKELLTMVVNEVDGVNGVEVEPEDKKMPTKSPDEVSKAAEAEEKERAMK